MTVKNLGSKKSSGAAKIGQRRANTRSSGFKTHPDSSGNEYETKNIESYNMAKNDTLEICFTWEIKNNVDWMGFGGWFIFKGDIVVKIQTKSTFKSTKTHLSPDPDWVKFGSMWQGGIGQYSVKVLITAIEDSDISIFKPECGSINHEYLLSARPNLLTNMYQFSPEAHFYQELGEVSVSINGSVSNSVKAQSMTLHLKKCNRCARYLPFNLPNERNHLSFTNHCTTPSSVPCKHSGFSKLHWQDKDIEIVLTYGLQLECRYCKKFSVNAAHNIMRTPAQMKEDGARRRILEALISELNGGSRQLSYRHTTGRELTDDVYIRFNKKCFKCNSDLKTANLMHLDHTRPLALLWPLDETATCLCKTCNSSKSDKYPSEFYTNEELLNLSKITNIPYDDLISPSPNIDIIKKLLENLDWFLDVYLKKPECQVIRDGKKTADLIVLALQRAIDEAPANQQFSITNKYLERRESMP